MYLLVNVLLSAILGAIYLGIVAKVVLQVQKEDNSYMWRLRDTNIFSSEGVKFFLEVLSLPEVQRQPYFSIVAHAQCGCNVQTVNKSGTNLAHIQTYIL